MSALTASIIDLLNAGLPIGTQLPSHRHGFERWVIVYPSGAGHLAASRFSVVRYQAAPDVLASGQPGRDNSQDYEVAYGTGLAALKAAIEDLAGAVTTLAPIEPNRLVIREEPGNWRIEFDGQLQASNGSRAGALSFAAASAQHFYEYDGVVPAISIIEKGIETRLRWAPNHDFIDDLPAD